MQQSLITDQQFFQLFILHQAFSAVEEEHYELGIGAYLLASIERGIIHVDDKVVSELADSIQRASDTAGADDSRAFREKIVFLFNGISNLTKNK